MEINNKHLISDLLKKRMEEKKISQQKAATSIGISAGTINQIINKNWEGNANLVSDEMFQKVSSWLGTNKGWVIVETEKNFKKGFLLCRLAQNESSSKMIVAPPGHGKSNSLRHYGQRNPNVFYVECGEFWTKKVFLSKLKQAMGIPDYGGTTPEMVEDCLNHLRTLEKPLIIIDECDKLRPAVLELFNYFFNKTLDQCGYILAGAPYLKKRIEEGLHRNRQGYKELFSRVGGCFLNFNTPSADMITEISLANGLTDEFKITQVINYAQGDYRRVKAKIERLKLGTKDLTENND